MKRGRSVAGLIAVWLAVWVPPAAAIARPTASSAEQASGRAADQRGPAGAVADTGAAQGAPIPAESASAAAAASGPGWPVVLGGDTLFRIRARLGPYGAAQRAAAITSRLEALSSAPRAVAADTVLVLESTSDTELKVGGVVLLSVTDADGAAEGTTREVLARRYAGIVARALRERAETVSVKALALGVVYSLIVTAVLVLLLRLFAAFFPRVYRLIGLWRRTKIPSLRIQKLELVSSERIADALVVSARVVRFVATALLLYLYVPLVFSFFPWTRGLSSQLLDYIWQPVSGVASAIAGYLPNLLSIGVILIATYYLLKLIRFFFDGIANRRITFEGFYPDWADPTYKIVRFLVFAFAVILIWPYLPKSSSEGFKGVAAFLGLLLTFGSASAVANVFGGLVMVYMRPFQVGDRVKIADTVGDVVAKNLLVTRVRTIKNVDITVPNSMVLGSHIINYSSTAAERGVILHTTVTIGYDAPWRDVHAALLQAAGRTEGTLDTPPPFVLQTALNDFYVSYEINVYTRHPNRMATIYSELHRNIQDAFNEAGIEITSPHYEALRDGNAAAVPPDYVPAGYAAPTFRVESVEARRDAEPDSAAPPAR